MRLRGIDAEIFGDGRGTLNYLQRERPRIVDLANQGDQDCQKICVIMQELEKVNSKGGLTAGEIQYYTNLAFQLAVRVERYKIRQNGNRTPRAGR